MYCEFVDVRVPIDSNIVYAAAIPKTVHRCASWILEIPSPNSKRKGLVLFVAVRLYSLCKN